MVKIIELQGHINCFGENEGFVDLDNFMVSVTSAFYINTEYQQHHDIILKYLVENYKNVNRHSIDILPPCIIPYLKKDECSRFSTTHGKVYDLREFPSVKGLIGRLIFNFDD